jgi:hypothetical protein
VPIQTGPENALKFKDWLDNRGGIFQWNSADLSDPGWGCFTPASTNNLATREDTNKFPYPKPHWKAADDPILIESADDVLIVVPKEIKRFHVAVRVGSQGLSLKLTDASSARLRREVSKLNERRAERDAWHEFDYSTQEAILYVPSESLSLPEWLAKHPQSVSV